METTTSKATQIKINKVQMINRWKLNKFTPKKETFIKEFIELFAKEHNLHHEIAIGRQKSEVKYSMLGGMVKAATKGTTSIAKHFTPTHPYVAPIAGAVVGGGYMVI